MNFEELWAFAGRNPVYSLALVGLTIAILGNELSRLFRGYKTLQPAELTRLINQDNAQVFDLRPYADFQKGHIAGSKNVLMSQFDPDAKPLASAKDQPVVLVCQSGMSVAAPAKRLKKAGFARVHVLDGGIAAWQQAELPLVKGKG